jgi:Uma2 family endonuclease
VTSARLYPDLLLRSLDATWDRARWEQLSDDGSRYEVIAGVLYRSTVPTPLHQWIVRQAARLLMRQICEPGIGVVFWSPIGLFMPGCDPVQPDLLVIHAADRGIVGERGIEGVPALLIEVLSPSNPEQDLVVKRACYARAGVPEYWIIWPKEWDILVHHQPEPATGQYTQISRIAPDEELVSPTLPFRAPVAAFFADAPGATA